LKYEDIIKHDTQIRIHKTLGVRWLFGYPATHQHFAVADRNLACNPSLAIPENFMPNSRNTVHMRNILIITLITISQFAFANFGGYIKQDSEGAGNQSKDNRIDFQ